MGGLAVALAAQKTIENLFGGISVIGDRPVLVGDACRFGDRTGTVMHIGLRSTRIRTPERTIISVPNGQFSSMALENISGRDKIWFHPTLNLRRDTTSDQLQKVLSSIREVLSGHPQVETGKMPVRFIGVSSYSLDIEIAAYITTRENDEFLALQQQLLIDILREVERAGTALAVPLQENFDLRKHPSNLRSFPAVAPELVREHGRVRLISRRPQLIDFHLHLALPIRILGGTAGKILLLGFLRQILLV